MKRSVLAFWKVKRLRLGRLWDSAVVRLLLVIVVLDEVIETTIEMFSSSDLYHEYRGLFCITPVLTFYN